MTLFYCMGNVAEGTEARELGAEVATTSLWLDSITGLVKVYSHAFPEQVQFQLAMHAHQEYSKQVPPECCDWG